jgi:eukaryotic-like serine/threonine-protein kinase
MPSQSRPSYLGRFEVLRTLGKGGAGIVYACKDGYSGLPVALKELQLEDTESVFRFKREFRILSQLRHPNFIRLHELHDVDGNWFFTMDQVEGKDFLSWVSGPSGPHLERLRRSLDELTAAIAALHDAGYAHCDIKSPNVRVDQNGKLVVLDLGLATPIGQTARLTCDRLPNAGTPVYTAPEQGAGQEVSAASDLYSVGVLIFVALTGRFPFEGPRKEVLRNKQLYEVRWPSHAADAVDGQHELRDLCLRLLSIEPEQRPTLAELRDTMGFTRTRPSDGFVGRHAELHALAAHDRACRERFSAVVITGESGIGKTSLAETFVGAHTSAIVLRARCYDGEAIPFNALDGLVDGLSRSFEDEDLASVLHELEPHTRASLLRHFPILSRGLRPGSGPTPTALAITITSLDRTEARSRAVEGLRFLLGTLARTRRVYLLIDDLHWADADSIEALGLLFAPRNAPPVFLVVTHRPVTRATDGAERVTREWESVKRIRLTGLAADEAGALAKAYGVAKEASDRYVADCGGHPLFLRSLLLAHAATGEANSSGGLDSLLDGIVRSVGIDEQTVLGLLSLCPRPLQRRALQEASGLGPRAFATAIVSLTEKRLARSRGPRETDTVESYHDRTADLVRRRMHPSVRLESHRQLCLAMARNDVPIEDVLDHLEAVGDCAGARRKALEAARASHAAYAFAHAVSLFDRVVRLSTDGDLDLPNVLSELRNARSPVAQSERERTPDQTPIALEAAEPPLAILQRAGALPSLSSPLVARARTLRIHSEVVALRLEAGAKRRIAFVWLEHWLSRTTTTGGTAGAAVPSSEPPDPQRLPPRLAGARTVLESTSPSA